MAYTDEYMAWAAATQQLQNMIDSQRDYELQNKIAESDIQLAEKQFALSEENQKFNHMIADRNFGLQVAKFDYENRLNQLKMQREDNAIQRRVNDFVHAGFSPLSAIGSNGAGVGNLLSGQTPQFDPTGINSSVDKQINALQSKQGAYARQMQAIQEKRQSRMQAMAYTMEMSNMFTQIANNKAQRQLLQEEISTQRYKNEYYERFGYNEESPTERLLSKLINFATDKYEDLKDKGSKEGNTPLEQFDKDFSNYVHTKRDKSIYSALSNTDKLNTFYEKLKETTNGKLSYFAIENFINYARFNFGFDPYIDKGRVYSLSNEEVQNIINNFEQYKTNFINNFKVKK